MSSPTKKTYFNWSSGKDSALALFYLLRDKNYRIDKLITTVTQGYDRVTMHGLRKDLLLKQTKAIGIEADIINLPNTPSMKAYENTMLKQTLELKSQNFTHSVFGDIFLEDLKAYRESQLHKIGIETIFPLWKKHYRTYKRIIVNYLATCNFTLINFITINHFGY